MCQHLFKFLLLDTLPDKNSWDTSTKRNFFLFVLPFSLSTWRGQADRKVSQQFRLVVQLLLKTVHYFGFTHADIFFIRKRVPERCCTAPIWKVKSHVLDRFSPVWSSSEPLLFTPNRRIFPVRTISFPTCCRHSLTNVLFLNCIGKLKQAKQQTQ